MSADIFNKSQQTKKLYMYKIPQFKPTSLSVNQSYEGESIEEKVMRILNNKEPIKDGAPQIYTDRKDGVNPAYDIRTDRFEIAIDVMDKVNKSKLASREERIKARDEIKKLKENEGKKGGENEGGALSTVPTE